MSDKVAPIDFFLTVGAFILVLGVYKMVRPVLRSYASTRVVSDELKFDNPVTVSECSKIESKTCCRAGARGGMVDIDIMNNCHLCGHPDCTGVEARQDDPGISLPFKKNIVNVIRPRGANDFYDYVNSYARAYAVGEPDRHEPFPDDLTIKKHIPYQTGETIDCDGPRPWHPQERLYYNGLTTAQKRRYLVTREIEFKKLCQESARQINQHELDQADPMQLSLKDSLMFPTAHGPYKATFKPDIHPPGSADKWIDFGSAYARAYAGRVTYV